MVENLTTSDNPSVPTIAVSLNSPADIATPITGQNPAPEPGSTSNRPAVSISAFEGAKDFTLNNPVINNVAGNQSVFKFDGSKCTC